MQHPDSDVQSALTRLQDALCSWERSTGRQSVLTLREDGGFVVRSMSGKPIDERNQRGVTDEILLGSIVP